MGRDEFLVELQNSLAGQVPDIIIQDNLNYYRTYIQDRISGGQSEESVVASLGNPRLLAKTIIESNKFAHENSQGYERTYESAEDSSQDNRYEASKVHQVPQWLFALGVIVIIAVIIGLCFCLITYLAPVIIVVLLITFAVRIFRNLTS